MAPAHLLSLKDLSCTFFGRRELQESGSTECSIHTVPMTRLCTQLTLIWEATSYGNFSLLFHKKMTMRKEVQCSRNLEHYHYYAKKKKNCCWLFSPQWLDVLSDGKLMILVTLGYQKSHEMSEGERHKAIFISSTELLRNTLI